MMYSQENELPIVSSTYHIIINTIDNTVLEIAKSRVIFVIHVCVVATMRVHSNAD